MADKDTRQRIALAPGLDTRMEVLMWTKDTIDRFWSKVDIGNENDCWEWQGWRKSRGYGNFLIDGRIYTAHRVSFILSLGEIEEGMEICHSCNNPSCCNPKHLWQGTHQQNMDDMVGKGRSKGLTGSDNRSVIYTEDLVLEIRRLYAAGVRKVEIARRFGLNRTYVTRVTLRQIWKHV